MNSKLHRAITQGHCHEYTNVVNTLVDTRTVSKALVVSSSMPLLRQALLILLATPLPCGAANSSPTIRPGPLTSSITGDSVYR
jgi:hypothetical protein